MKVVNNKVQKVIDLSVMFTSTFIIYGVIGAYELDITNTLQYICRVLLTGIIAYSIWRTLSVTNILITKYLLENDSF